MAASSNCARCRKKQCTCKNGCEKCRKVKDGLSGVWMAVRDGYCKC